MKYAHEIRQAFACYPDREWKMAELVAWCGGRGATRDYVTERQNVLRVVQHLRKHGYIEVIEKARNSYLYRRAQIPVAL